MEKVDYFLGKILELLVSTFLAITVIVTFLQVFFRYVLKQPLGWSQEVLLISFVYCILFGAALCIKNKEHLQVDLLDNAPEWVKKLATILEFVVVGIIIVIFIYFGYQLVQANFSSGQIVGLLPIKYAYVYLSVPISGVIMLYFHIRQVIKCFG
ncbi:TRAP transporter small permease [Anaerobacillus sp. MEB173]|uniref:TRAP transporter small permease n=1 Tax=Anaerobacillus sp. MEB173 TaxID=3383345 RepID=UPI003F8DE4C0